MLINNSETKDVTRHAIIPIIAFTAVCAFIASPTQSFAAQNATTDVRVLQMNSNSTNTNENTNSGNTNENGSSNTNRNDAENGNSENTNGNDSSDNQNENDNGNGTSTNANGDTTESNEPGNGSPNDATNTEESGKKPSTPLETVGSILQTGLTNIWLWIIIAIAAVTGIIVEIKKHHEN